MEEAANERCEFRGDTEAKLEEAAGCLTVWMRVHEKRMISRLWSGPLEMMASFMEMRTLEPEEVREGDLSPHVVVQGV